MSEEQAPAAGAAGGKSKNILMFAAIALSAVNIAATIFVILALQHPIVVETKVSHETSHDSPGDGPTMPLDTFVVNLNEKGSTRYLKTSVELQLSRADTLPELERSKPAIRDELLRYLSSLTVDETAGEDGKKKIQKQMIARVEKILGEGKVNRLYFNEFVVQ